MTVMAKLWIFPFQWLQMSILLSNFEAFFKNLFRPGIHITKTRVKAETVCMSPVFPINQKMTQ